MVTALPQALKQTFGAHRSLANSNTSPIIRNINQAAISVDGDVSRGRCRCNGFCNGSNDFNIGGVCGVARVSLIYSPFYQYNFKANWISR